MKKYICPAMQVDEALAALTKEDATWDIWGDE